jgi:hypothetical protein
MGELLDMGIHLDPITGREDDPLATLGIVGELFEGFFQGRLGKIQALAQFDWRGFMA